MKIQVLDDAGELVLNYDTKSSDTPVGFVTMAQKTAVAAAMHDATQLLLSDHHVIASIKADIQAAVARIETELGAHPAFTWAQTKLGNAAAHLEHYVKGIWTDPLANGVPVDERGFQVPPSA